MEGYPLLSLIDGRRIRNLLQSHDLSQKEGEEESGSLAEKACCCFGQAALIPVQRMPSRLLRYMK